MNLYHFQSTYSMHSLTVVRKVAVAAQPVRIPTDFLDGNYRNYMLIQQ